MDDDKNINKQETNNDANQNNTQSEQTPFVQENSNESNDKIINQGSVMPFLKTLIGWATFKAVIDIIMGALSCIPVITAAFGIPKIISGLRLLNAADDLKLYISNGDTRKVGDALYNFNKYFKLSGISIIIKISFSILLFIAYIILIGLIIRYSDEFFRDFATQFEY